MECSQPGAIRDEEFIAYLEGENVRPAVVEHLAHCQKCSAQLAAYQRMERTLTRKLYRWDCPSNQLLGEYTLGVLDHGKAVTIRAHLSICVLCTAEMATLTNFLAADPFLQTRMPEEARQEVVLPTSATMYSAAQEVRRKIEHVGEQTLVGVRRIAALLLPPQPDLVYQRSSMQQTGSWPRNYQAEDILISLQLESSPKQRGKLQLIGFVTRQGQSVAALQGICTQLTPSEGVVQTQYIDELGNVIFSALLPATYTLELQFPEGTVVVEHLAVQFQP